RPDPQQFRPTPEDVEKVRQLVSRKLANFSALASTDPDFELISEFLKAYHYGYNDVKDNLAIDRIPNTDYIEVYMAADKPGLAALGANAFCEEFVRYSRSLKSERSSESVEFLRELSETKKAELDKKL